MSSPSGNPFGQDISSDESEYVPVYSGQSSSGDEVIVVTTPDFGVTAIDFDVPAILDDGGVLPHVSERVNPRLKSVAEYFATQFLRFGLRTDAQISFKLVRYDMPNQMVPMAQAINILYGIGTKADLRTIQVMAGGGLLPDLDPECSAEEVRRYAFSFQDRLIHYFIASMPWMDEPISKIAKIQLREKKCLYIHEIYEKYGELKFAKFLDKDKKSSLRITPHSFFASMDNIARGMYGPDYAQRFFSPITWGRFWIGILFTFLLTSLPAIAWSAYQSHTKDVMRGEISDLRDTLSNFTRYIGNHTKSIEDREYVLLDFTKSISDHADRLEKRESELDREIYSLAEIINASITVAVPTTTTIVSTTEKLLTTTHTVVKTLVGAPTPIRVTETVVDIVTTPLATTSVATTTSHYDVMEYFGDEIPDRATQIYVICAVTVTAAVVLSFIFMAVRSFSCCRGKKGNRNHDVERNSSYTVFNPSIPVR